MEAAVPADEPSHVAARLTRWAQGGVKMFGWIYDKADWAVALLLVAAIVTAVFA